MDWLIRYRDGSEFSDEDGAPWAAPRTGVMAVLQRDPLVDVTVLRSSTGAWAWKYGQWVALDSDWAIWDYWWHHMDEHMVLLSGEGLPDPMWRDRREMYEDTKAHFGQGKTLMRRCEAELVSDLSK